MFKSNPTGVFKGAVITIAMRWTDRLIGFISTLLLARLLVPDDLGIVAMASMVVGVVDVFLNLGVNVALIRNREASLAHFNTAWTMRLIQVTFSSVIIFLGAPYAADYFNDPRVELVLQIMAISTFVVGLENIGVVSFQIEMRFGTDFKYMFLKRFAGFIITIFCAWWLRNYWALIIGTLGGRIFGVLLSYKMHPMRPRFSIEKMREIFSISQWMLVNSTGSYLNRNLHKILVGRRTAAAVVGGYTLADEISAMPSSEVLAPLNRVLFPAFVKAKHDLNELKRLFLLAQGVQSLVGIPVAVGLILVAREAVLVLLGEKWLFVASFVQVLSLVKIIEAITTSAGYVLFTLGKIRNAAFLQWIQLSTFIIGAVLILPNAGALELAWLRVATVTTGIFLSLSMLIYAMGNVSASDIVHVTLRPILGTVVMALALAYVPNVPRLPVLVLLILKIGLGLTIYPSVVLLLWHIAGRPPGAEAYLLDKLAIGLKRVGEQKLS